MFFDEDGNFIERPRRSLPLPRFVKDEWTLTEEEKLRRQQMATSEGRFNHRKKQWKQEKFGQIKHYGWWILHNIPSHILIGIFPCRVTFKFHDWSSNKLNRK